MKRIGIISDTHGYLDNKVFTFFEHCDEVWHAGDIGNVALAEQLEAFRPLRAVYGNVDGADLRIRYPEKLRFHCEGVDVLMTHIGGYPGRYSKDIKAELLTHPPKLFICGHSHILKIIFDDKLQCLHINPGAAGNHGWHKIRTLVRLNIDGEAMKNCEVIELGNRYQ